MKNLFYIVLMTAISFTAFSQKHHKKHSKAHCPRYTEDLTAYRNRYQVKEDTSKPVEVKTVKPTKDVTRQVDARLDSIRQNAPKQAQGYRVLVYTGQSREEAERAYGKARQAVNKNTHTYRNWTEPSWRVKVGDCFDKLEAQELLNILRVDFPDARIIQDKINIKQE